MRRRAAELAAVVLMSAVSVPARAQQPEPETRPIAPQAVDPVYATYLGDGMRDYTEGRYDEAVAKLFRAYALRPEPQTLSLIVRAYDFMGHCTARARQAAMFTEAHPGRQPPAPQRCAQPATVTFACETAESPLRVDATIEARCNTPIQLAPGPHKVELLALRHTEPFTARPGQTETVKLRVKPQKWSGSTHPRVPLLGNERAPNVPLLHDPYSQRYTVIMSRDGIYRIWMHQPSSAYDNSLLRPYQEPRFICTPSANGQMDCKPAP